MSIFLLHARVHAWDTCQRSGSNCLTLCCIAVPLGQARFSASSTAYGNYKVLLEIQLTSLSLSFLLYFCKRAPLLFHDITNVIMQEAGSFMEWVILSARHLNFHLPEFLSV